MRSKVFYCLLFLTLNVFAIKAQNGKDNETRLQNGEDLNVLYRNEATFGIFAHSAGGLGIAYRRGRQVTVDHKKMFEIEAQNFKHPKEVKTVSSLGQGAKGYVYGKLNSFLIFRPGIGFENRLYQKSDKKSVEIRYAYFIGATINFAKPIYLEIRNSQSDQSTSVERYDPEIHNQTNIYGKAPFLTGIEHTTIYPGGYAKFALSFEYSNKYNGVKAIETGVLADIYPQVIPMMAYNENQQVYVQLYIKFMFGKKWF